MIIYIYLYILNLEPRSYQESSYHMTGNSQSSGVWKSSVHCTDSSQMANLLGAPKWQKVGSEKKGWGIQQKGYPSVTHCVWEKLMNISPGFFGCVFPWFRGRFHLFHPGCSLASLLKPRDEGSKSWGLERVVFTRIWTIWDANGCKLLWGNSEKWLP